MKNRKHINLTAYDNYEQFGSRKELLQYRSAKLKECRIMLKHVKKHFGKRKLKILELGSGNCCMLIALHKAGMVKYAHGIEISKARHEFAQQWIDDIGAGSTIRSINADFMKYPFDKGYDLVLCLDMAFQFVEPIKEDNETKLLNKIDSALKFGGKSFIEFGDLESLEPVFWKEFPKPDPWRWMLSTVELHPKGLPQVLWKKTFIRRDLSAISEKAVYLQIYQNVQNINSLLIPTTEGKFLKIERKA